MKENLEKIYDVLNSIEIKGDKNISYMYWVLDTLSQTINQIKKQESLEIESEK